MPAKTSSGKSARSATRSHAAILPIERIAIVGAGGNGSIFLTHLCRIWFAWTRLGGRPFGIDLYDPDVVSESNLARQCFCEADIGLPKALVLAQRVAAFFGLKVNAHVQQFTSVRFDTSMVVGCVDNLEARRCIHNAIKVRSSGFYWLDLGNSDTMGQVVLGGHRLPTLFDLYPHMLSAKDEPGAPSCSMAEALSRQDLFINSTIANLGGHLLWQLMRHGGVDHHGYVVNLNAGMVLPIPVATSPCK